MQEPTLGAIQTLAFTASPAFLWHEYFARDLRASADFYGHVFGWVTKPFGQKGRYLTLHGPQGPFGGIMQLPRDASELPWWMGSIGIDDVDETAALAARLGGQIYQEPTTLPHVGRYAVVGSTHAGRLGLFRPSLEMELGDAGDHPMVSWSELITHDRAEASTFYTALVGWEVRNEAWKGAWNSAWNNVSHTERGDPCSDPWVFGTAGQKMGTVGSLATALAPREAPAQWAYYGATENLDAAVERALRNNARVIGMTREVPWGRDVQLVDPDGALFGIHERPT